MIELVIDARRKDLGGFEVGRILPFARRRMVGPFVFLDHMGPATLAPGGGLDVRPHPHIGLSTVTYLFEGEILHRDSLGYTQPIRPGEVNWMTAGRGIVHSERSDAAFRVHGGPMHGMQAWVALPERDEETDPAFHHQDAQQLPVFEGDGAWGRLIAGSAFGKTAPTRVFSPLFYVHWELTPGSSPPLPSDHEERALYVVRGQLEVDGHLMAAGQMLVLGPGQPPRMIARTEATVMALGGAPLGHRYIWWNLVSSRAERIEQAKADWAAGRMTLPPGDDQEFIPLPTDRPFEPKGAEPMS